MPPLTTERKITTLKTKDNQNCQKIELYGSLTTKDLKKTYSSGPVKGRRQVTKIENTHSKAAAGEPGWARWQLVEWWSHISMPINQEE